MSTSTAAKATEMTEDRNSNWCQQDKSLHQFEATAFSIWAA